jgi:hypothetical protein
MFVPKSITPLKMLEIESESDVDINDVNVEHGKTIPN